MTRTFRGLIAAGAIAAAASALSAPAGAAALPDGRAYELVSPLESRGIDVSAAWTMPDGAHAISLAKINDPQGLRIATRGADGWSTKRVGLDPPATNRKLNTTLIDVADDLSRLAVEATPPDGSVRNQVWVQTLADGSWAHVGGKVRFAAGSSDLTTVVVVPARAADDPYPELASGSRVFRWHDGAVASIGDDARRVAVCGAVVADGGGARTADQNGVSADGRTVVLTNLSAGADGCRDPATDERYLPHVLVWRDGKTVDVSQPIAGAADSAATYVGNSADGSAVFFTTAAQLEEADVNGVADLYRYDVERRALTRVSAAATFADGAAVTAAISADEGGAVWFATTLAAGGEGLWSWTAGARPRLVAAAAAGAFAFTPKASARESQTQLTPDGRVVVWRTSARLGGSAGAGAALIRATADGDVVCVSCSSNGAGLADFGVAPDGLQLPLARVSPDGEQVVFKTGRRVLPDDLDLFPDVYVWNDGVQSRISSGDSGGTVEMGGISRDGQILFIDRARLLPWIEDEHVKVYQARIGGGFPAPPSPTPECTGDDCQGTPGLRPGPPALGSEGHAGPDDADDPEQSWAPDPAVRIGKVGPAAKRRLARGRAIALKVRATSAGRVTATVRIKAGKRWLRAGGAARTLKRAGTAKLTVRLTRGARKRLARRGALRVRIVVSHSRAVRDARTAFVLKQKKAGRGR